jgi:hypothetical protein
MSSLKLHLILTLTTLLSKLMTTKQFLINTLSNTFAERCDALVAQDKLSDARALYEEWIVDGVDPEDESIDFEWTFITNLTV